MWKKSFIVGFEPGSSAWQPHHAEALDAIDIVQVHILRVELDVNLILIFGETKAHLNKSFQFGVLEEFPLNIPRPITIRWYHAWGSPCKLNVTMMIPLKREYCLHFSCASSRPCCATQRRQTVPFYREFSQPRRERERSLLLLNMPAVVYMLLEILLTYRTQVTQFKMSIKEKLFCSNGTLYKYFYQY